MIKFSVQQLQELCKNKKYWFPNGKRDWDCFLFGVRASNRNQSMDLFDDLLGIAFQKAGAMQMYTFPATTDPGKQELLKPSFQRAQEEGTAVMKPGQYRGAYEIGIHGTGGYAHKAFRQVGPVAFYSDPNRDAFLNIDEAGVKVSFECVGLNIHCAYLRGTTYQIGPYSAGCQVVQVCNDLRFMLSSAQEQINAGMGNRFTYTLFDEKDFVLLA